MTDLEKYIDSLNKQKEDIELQLKSIEVAKHNFPDLDYHKSRWGTVRLTSPSVNSIADYWERNYSCGCCPDAAVYISAYIIIKDSICNPKGIFVYAKPIQIYVGEKCSYRYIDVPDYNWKNNLVKYGLPSKIIDEVGFYFTAQEEYLDNSNEEENEDY